MRIIGVDPGVNGACGVITETGNFVEAFEMPTVIANKSSNRQMVNAYELAAQLRRILGDADGDIVAITESVNAMPDQGVASVFAFGKSFGIVLGVLAALGISTELVSPVRWKKHFELAGGEKEQARELAIRLFPAAPMPLKKHHNRAEALLIARYYRDVYLRPAPVIHRSAEAAGVPF